MLKIIEEKSIREIINTEQIYTVHEDDEVLELEPDQFARFKVGQTLELCYKLIELPDGKRPDTDSSRLIAMNVCKYHADLTVADIFLAFELAVNEIINVNVEHYQTVGVKYVTAILRGYKSYRNKKIRDIEKKINEYNRDLVSETKKCAYKDDRAIKMIIMRHYKAVLDDKEFSCYLTPECYDHLRILGLINLSKEDKARLLGLAENKNYYPDGSRFKTPMFNIHDSQPKTQAMILAVLEHFNLWKLTGLSLFSLARRISVACYVDKNYFHKLAKARLIESDKNNEKKSAGL